jgi:hypothetical protein
VYGTWDDDHAVEQAFVLALLQEFAEFGQVGVGEDGLVEINQREACHLDILFLRQRQQQIEEFALDLEDFDHLQQAAAGCVHGAGPRPGARIAFVATLRHARQIHRADQVGNIGGVRIVRRVGADGAAPGLGNEMRSTGMRRKSPPSSCSSRARQNGHNSPATSTP